jgi:hydrogenase maturation factor
MKKQRKISYHKIIFCSLAFLLNGCAQRPPEQAPLKLEEVHVSSAEIRNCQRYQQEVLLKAHHEIRKPQYTQLIFTPNADEALYFISQFDVGQGLPDKKSNLIRNIIHRCDAVSLEVFNQNFKRLNECSLSLSELGFFQALAAAIQEYKWPASLKLEAKGLALNYVRYFSQGDYPLIHRLVALSVLDELSVREIIDIKLHQKIKSLMLESQQYVEALQRRIALNSVQGCESVSVIRDELKYSRQMALQMQQLLGQL